MGVVIDLFTLGTQVEVVNLKMQGSIDAATRSQEKYQAQNIIINVNTLPSESIQKTPVSGPELAQLP